MTREREREGETTRQTGDRRPKSKRRGEERTRKKGPLVVRTSSLLACLLFTISPNKIDTSLVLGFGTAAVFFFLVTRVEES